MSGKMVLDYSEKRCNVSLVVDEKTVFKAELDGEILRKLARGGTMATVSMFHDGKLEDSASPSVSISTAFISTILPVYLSLLRSAVGPKDDSLEISDLDARMFLRMADDVSHVAKMLVCCRLLEQRKEGGRAKD